MFSQSKILQELPEQFFASLVAKVNAKVAEGYDVINLGRAIQTSQLMITLLML